MVERVARGRIMVPAAAALTVIAAGMIKSEPAHAAGRETTLEIRVQVVEPCRIRIGPSGLLDQSCGGGAGITPASVRIAELTGQLQSTAALRPGGFTVPAQSRADMTGGIGGTGAADRLAAANQRASAIALRISERVRYITVAY